MATEQETKRQRVAGRGGWGEHSNVQQDWAELRTVQPFPKESKDMETIFEKLLANGVVLVETGISTEEMSMLQKGFNELLIDLVPDGRNAPKGTAGCLICKRYGAASSKASMQARLQEKVQKIFQAFYDNEDCAVSVDAPTLVPESAKRQTSNSKCVHPEEARYFNWTGGSFPLHIDYNTEAEDIERLMQQRGFSKPYAVQGQLVVHSVPEGGSTFVCVPGNYVGADYREQVAGMFKPSDRAFRTCKSEEYKHFERRTCAFDGLAAGTLILWLSRTPHGNKLSDKDVSTKRGGQFVCWMPKNLQAPDLRQATKDCKLKGAERGASTDHWPLQPADKMAQSRGGHMSNPRDPGAPGRTTVLFDEKHPAGEHVWGPELTARLREAC
tara:strand:- start:1127 stop:2278 length:1152 start_codon:yes stop_codon:yes gene_type:complete